MNTANACWHWLLQTSWQASILVLLVMAIQLLLRTRLAPRWRYALWLLVVARLVMPATPASPLSVFNFTRHVLPASAGGIGEVSSGMTIVNPNDKYLEAAPAKETAGRQRSVSWHDGLMVLWAAIACVLFARMAFGNYRLSSRVCKQRPVTKQAVLDILEDCKQELHVHIPINVVESSDVQSPALLGFIRPRLLLPERMIQNFDAAELRLVFLHELAHLKRHDIVFNWLISALQVLHWFNPLIALAFYRMRVDRELACDSLVLSFGREQESRRYGQTMIKLLEFSSAPKLVPGVVGILEDRNELKGRMTMIAAHTKHTYQFSGLAAGLILILGMTTLTGANEKTQAPSGVSLENAKPHLNLDFELGPRTGTTYPSAWGGGGEGYEFTADGETRHTGGWAGRIHNTRPSPEGFGSLTATLAPETLAGKRVRFSGYLKLAEVTGYVALWIRADKQQKPVAFQTLQGKNVHGTRDWAAYTVEVEFPADIDNINFGVLLAGGGTLWADDLEIEIVGGTVFDAQPAQEALTRWLGLVDGERYEESWDDASVAFRAAVTSDDWVRMVGTVRRPLGKVISRTIASSIHQTNLPGAPDGDYVIFQTETSFEKKKSAVETVTMMKQDDGSWRGAGYFIR
ncbi:MAG: M56 family metallopeptidase [bacterium]